MAKATPVERFWAKVDRDGPVPEHAPQLGPCWLWIGSKDGGGYASFSAYGRGARAHRFSYETFVGPIPEGLQIDHLCRSRGCVNPDHLEPVTPSENTRRGVAFGTFGAPNRSKTHCPKGHPYDDANTVVRRRTTGRPERRCIQCDREKKRLWARRTRAARRAIMSAS